MCLPQYFNVLNCSTPCIIPEMELAAQLHLFDLTLNDLLALAKEPLCNTRNRHLWLRAGGCPMQTFEASF